MYWMQRVSWMMRKITWWFGSYNPEHTQTAMNQLNWAVWPLDVLIMICTANIAMPPLQPDWRYPTINCLSTQHKTPHCPTVRNATKKFRHSQTITVAIKGLRVSCSHELTITKTGGSHANCLGWKYWEDSCSTRRQIIIPTWLSVTQEDFWPHELRLGHVLTMCTPITRMLRCSLPSIQVFYSY
jgi:hypothetical protein